MCCSSTLSHYILVPGVQFHSAYFRTYYLPLTLHRIFDLDLRGDTQIPIESSMPHLGEMNNSYRYNMHTSDPRVRTQCSVGPIRALASARGSVVTQEKKKKKKKSTVTRGPEGPESGRNTRVRGPEGPEDELR